MNRTNQNISPKPKTPRNTKIQTLQQRKEEIKQRLSQLADHLIEEQNYYKMFGVNMWKGESFTIVQPEQQKIEKPALQNKSLTLWASMIKCLFKDYLKKNYAAWLIQSVWRCANGKFDANPPDLSDYFALSYPIICKAELKAIHQIANELLEENVSQILEPSNIEEEEDFEEDCAE